MLVPVLPPDLVMPLLGYLGVANLLALGLFALQRAGSQDGQWGRNETRTLFLAVMGGWPGAALGRALFRPKRETRGFGLILSLSVFALPVVMAMPFLLRALPGWTPQSGADRPAQIADSAAAGQEAIPAGEALPAAAAPAGTKVGTADGTATRTAVASEPASPTSTSTATADPSATGTASSSTATAPVMAATANAPKEMAAPTTTTTVSTAATAQTPLATTSSFGPTHSRSDSTVRRPALRARKLHK